MTNLILLEIALILMFVYFLFKLRHGFHMFQLESYKPERYKKWMKNNKTDLINIRELLLLIPLVALIFNIKISLILQIIITILMWISRNIYNEKKPLVITARVKRLYITSILIMLLVMATINIFFIKENTYLLIISFLVADIIIFLSMYFVKLANKLNMPIEQNINNKFYKKAKLKLKEMPNLKVIGITGSYGKTSTKYILSTILNQKFNVLITPGNFNTLLGVERTINEKLKVTDQIFICEMGAKNIGDIKEICDLVHPTYGVLTAIGPQHLDTFKTLDNIRKTKMELIDSLPEEGCAFINYEDENIKNTQTNKSNIKYGLNNNNEVYAYNIKMSEEGSIFDVNTPNGSIKNIKTKLLGENNIINIAGAISVAIKLGLTVEEIKLGISHLKPVEHRLELRKNPNGLIIIDDAYNSNIQGATKAFEALKLFENKKRVIVTPGIVELGEESEKYNEQIGKKAAECADFVILVGNKQAPPIKKGLLSQNYPEEQIYIAENINKAIEKWNEFVAEETVILLENDLPDNYL